MATIINKKAKKYFDKCDKTTQSTLRKAIYNLPKGNIKKLQGRTGYRLRVGDLRVIFDFSDNDIIIENIGPRGQIYK